MGWIFLLFVIAVPVVEIAVFIKVAGWIGILETVLITILAGFGGLLLLRNEGLGMLLRARAAMQRGEPPLAEMLDGMILACAGLLLLLPGLASDVIALVLLLPPTRALLRGGLARKVGRPGPPARPGVIEGEYEIIEPEEDPERRNDDRRLR